MVAQIERSNQLTVKDRKINTHSIFILPEVKSEIAKLYSIRNVESAESMFRQDLNKGECLGYCKVKNLKLTGYLIRVSDRLFAVLSANLEAVIYVSHIRHYFDLTEPPSDLYITINNESFNVSKTEFSNHFISQVSERMRIPNEEAPNLFYDVVLNGMYICKTHSKEDRRPAHLFIKDGILVFVSLDFKAAITAYRNHAHDLIIDNSVKKRIVDTLLSDVKRLTRKERAVEKRNTKRFLEIDYIIAKNNLELFNTTSNNKKDKLTEELKEAKEERRLIEMEQLDLQDRIRRTATSLAYFL